MKRWSPLALGALVLLGWTGPAGLSAQELTPHAPERLTAEDYRRAQAQLGGALQNLVLGPQGGGGWVHWTGDEEQRFWYWKTLPGNQVEYVLVNPRRIRTEEFLEPEVFATELRIMEAHGEGEPYTIRNLPFGDLEILDRRTVTFTIDTLRYTCDTRRVRCTTEAEPRLDRSFVVSPDGRLAAFRRDHNLWVRVLETGQEIQLTTDGEEDYGWATDNAGWVRRPSPVVRWSPDSRSIATFKHDARGVGMMYQVSTEVGHGELDAWRYPLPEDSVIFRIERAVIHLDEDLSPRVVPFDMAPDPHRSSVCDHIACSAGEYTDTQWSPDGTRLAFVSNTRDHKVATLRIADVETGEVRTVLEERVDTYFESGVDDVNWRVLWDRNEVLWWSERTDWGHFYRYDLDSGQLIAPLTSGEWVALTVEHLDPEGGWLYFMGGGREAGDPYFRYLYRVPLAGGEVELLTPDSANHTVDFAPNGAYFVDSWSTPTDPPVYELRTVDGALLMELEETDVTPLLETGWQPPEPFTVKARDGETDLYGLLFRPFDFDPSKKYPVVNYLYPGPQTGSIRTRSFTPVRRDHQALAELGFIVVALDAMGTPGRSKSFHDAYYGNMGDNGLPDQIAGIVELAGRYPQLDLDRVGIWGHSGGGFASTAGILQYPEFYKVAVSQAGNHENRNYEDDWAEKWQGLLEEYEDGTTNYDNQANPLLADRLEGKLLLAHGTLDDNVPPSNTLLMVDALIAANRDFDLILFPNRRHGFAFEPYMLRRRWDYFVEHLLGAQPPVEYDFRTGEGR